MPWSGSVLDGLGRCRKCCLRCGGRRRRFKRPTPSGSVVLGHADQRRTQQLFVEQVPLLEGLGHRARCARACASTMLIAWWRSGSKASPGNGAISTRPLASAMRCSSRSVSTMPSRSGSASSALSRPASMLSKTGSRSLSSCLLAKRQALRTSRSSRLRWFSRSARSIRDCARSCSSSAFSASIWSSKVSSSASGLAPASSCFVSVVISGSVAVVSPPTPQPMGLDAFDSRLGAPVLPQNPALNPPLHRRRDVCERDYASPGFSKAAPRASAVACTTGITRS